MVVVSRTHKKDYTDVRRWFGDGGQRKVKQAARSMNRAERRQANVLLSLGLEPEPIQAKGRGKYAL